MLIQIYSAGPQVVTARGQKRYRMWRMNHRGAEKVSYSLSMTRQETASAAMTLAVLTSSLGIQHSFVPWQTLNFSSFSRDKRASRVSLEEEAGLRGRLCTLQHQHECFLFLAHVSSGCCDILIRTQIKRYGSNNHSNNNINTGLVVDRWHHYTDWFVLMLTAECEAFSTRALTCF